MNTNSKLLLLLQEYLLLNTRITRGTEDSLSFWTSQVLGRPNMSSLDIGFFLESIYHSPNSKNLSSICGKSCVRESLLPLSKCKRNSALKSCKILDPRDCLDHSLGLKNFCLFISPETVDFFVSCKGNKVLYLISQKQAGLLHHLPAK